MNLISFLVFYKVLRGCVSQPEVTWRGGNAKKTSKSKFRVIESSKDNSRGLTAKSPTERPTKNVSAKDASAGNHLPEPISPQIVSEKFVSYLKKNGFRGESYPDEIGPALQQFIRTELPEIEAMQKMRSMLTAKPNAPKYVASLHGDTMKFYETYYQEGVRAGLLNHGSIKAADDNFVRAFNRNNELSLGNTIIKDSATNSKERLLGTILGGISDVDARRAMISSGMGAPRRR